MKKTILLAFVVGLTGCSDAMPEPNAATCAPGAYEEALAEIKSKSQRLAFTEECKSFQRAENMRKWKFKPSSPDRY